MERLYATIWRINWPCIIYNEWYGLCSCQGIHTSCTSRISAELLKKVSLCLYWTSLPHVSSTNHVNAELTRAIEAVWSSIWPLHVTRGPTIASHNIWRLRPHFWIKHKLSPNAARPMQRRDWPCSAFSFSHSHCFSGYDPLTKLVFGQT